jgi:hypothetical protein
VTGRDVLRDHQPNNDLKVSHPSEVEALIDVRGSFARMVRPAGVFG